MGMTLMREASGTGDRSTGDLGSNPSSILYTMCDAGHVT